MFRELLARARIPFGETSKRVLKNIGALTVLQALNYILPLISLPFLVRVLGIEKFGTVSFMRGTMLLLFLAVDYGFSYSATRRVAVERDDRDMLPRVAASITAARLVVALVCCFGLGIVCVLVPRFSQLSLGFVFSMGAVIGYALTPNWFFSGLEKMATLAAVSGATRIVYIIALLLFIRSPDDSLLVIALESISYLLAGGVSLYLVRRELPYMPSLPGWGEVAHALAEGGHYFLTTAAISTYTSLAIPILGIMTNDLVVGVYVAAERPIRALTSLITPVVQAIYPVMTKLAANEGGGIRIFDINCRLAWVVAASMSIVSGLVAIFAPQIVFTLYGSLMPEVVTIIRILAPMPFLIACASVTLNLGLLALGHRRIWSRIIYTATAIGLGLLFLLVYVFSLGGIGVAISVVFAEAFVCIAGFVLFMKLRSSASASGV